MKKYSLFFLLVLVLSACIPGGIAPTPDKLATVVAETLTAVSSNSVIPTLPINATFTPVPPQVSSTPEEMGKRYMYTAAQNVNLRVNPGRLFQVSRVMSLGTRLEVLGYAPGREWINVRNEEGIVGWVGIDFVDGGFDGPPPPEVLPADVLLVSGTVLDLNGKPVSGIGIGIFQNPQRDEVHTDETGTYYLFLPKTLSGSWSLQQLSISCTSNIMNANCGCLVEGCGEADPQSYTLIFPISITQYNFIWK